MVFLKSVDCRRYALSSRAGNQPSRTFAHLFVWYYFVLATSPILVVWAASLVVSVVNRAIALHALPRDLIIQPPIGLVSPGIKHRNQFIQVHFLVFGGLQVFNVFRPLIRSNVLLCDNVSAWVRYHLLLAGQEIGLVQDFIHPVHLDHVVEVVLLHIALLRYLELDRVVNMSSTPVGLSWAAARYEAAAARLNVFS